MNHERRTAGLLLQDRPGDGALLDLPELKEREDSSSSKPVEEENPT